MSLTLHDDPCIPGATPLTEAPHPYVAGRNGEYVHIPRSGYDATGRKWVSVRSWCGQQFRVGSDAKWMPGVPPGRLLCGTCYGRSLGYDDAAPGIAHRPTLTIRRLVHPARRWCPGRRLGLWVERAGHRNAECLLCGYVGRWNCSQGWNAYGVDIEPHEPIVDEALVWCPTCGWRHLRLVGAVVTCGAFGCSFRARTS